MCAFVSHPSVRIKGTENDFEPVQCLDASCTKKLPHWHCPFCQKSDFYSDPLILKAHYRVKHVDKGIEFAGLKVLRCCDHCDIVGTIKGAKKFKCAHWHCYKCRNGFNRRDEAIKHYRTHFRNPQTTFQIQIAQEVNRRIDSQPVQEQISAQDLIAVHPALIQIGFPGAIADGSFLQNEADSPDNSLSAADQSFETKTIQKSGSDIQVSVAANETVGTSAEASQAAMLQSGQETMIIIEQSGDNIYKTTGDITVDCKKDDGVQDGGVLVDKSAGAILVEAGENQDTYGMPWEQDKQELMSRINQLESEVKQLQFDKSALESMLEQTRQEMEKQSLLYQKRESDLVQKLSSPLPQRVPQIISQLKADYENLIHQHLLQLEQDFHIHQDKAEENEKDSPLQIGSHTAAAGSQNKPGPVLIIQSSYGSKMECYEEDRIGSVDDEGLKKTWPVQNGMCVSEEADDAVQENGNIAAGLTDDPELTGAGNETYAIVEFHDDCDFSQGEKRKCDFDEVGDVVTKRLK